MIVCLFVCLCFFVCLKPSNAFRITERGPLLTRGSDHTQFSFAARASQGPGPSSDLGRPKNRSCLFVRAFLCLSKTLQCFLNWGRGGRGTVALRGAQIQFSSPVRASKGPGPISDLGRPKFCKTVWALWLRSSPYRLSMFFERPARADPQKPRPNRFQWNPKA